MLSDLALRFRRVTASGTYVPQIDGLRFLAIMPVLFFHAGLRGARISPDPAANEALMTAWLPAGGVGVSLFFFISGYIIAYPFLIDRAPALGHFYTRRLMRLEPPYFIVMIGCFLLLSLYTPSSAPNFDYTPVPLWQSLLASLTYTHGIVFGQNPKLNPPAWSLEIEMQFYLVAPFLIWAYLRIRRRTTRLWVGAATCVAGLLLGETIRHYVGQYQSLYHTILAQSYCFILGVLICDHSVKTQPFLRPARRNYDYGLLCGLIGLLLTGVFEPRINGLGLADPAAGTLYGSLNAGVRAISICLIFFGAARGARGRAVLANPWLTLIGGACYSIYLVHLPVSHAAAEIVKRVMRPDSLLSAAAVCWIILIPLSIAIGLLFYVLVERPCMRPDWPANLAGCVKRLVSGVRRRVTHGSSRITIDPGAPVVK